LPPQERGESTEGTVDTLRRRMNEVKEKKKGEIAREHENKAKEAEASIDSTPSMGEGDRAAYKAITGRDPPPFISWALPCSLFDPFMWVPAAKKAGLNHQTSRTLLACQAIEESKFSASLWGAEWIPMLPKLSSAT
jgi:hypothetical protein